MPIFWECWSQFVSITLSPLWLNLFTLKLHRHIDTSRTLTHATFCHTPHDTRHLLTHAAHRPTPHTNSHHILKHATHQHMPHSDTCHTPIHATNRPTPHTDVLTHVTHWHTPQIIHATYWHKPHYDQRTILTHAPYTHTCCTLKIIEVIGINIVW